MDNEIPIIIRVPKEQLDNVTYIADFIDADDPPEETYKLALESIFRWTLRRDELDDSQIVLAIKRVAKYALANV